jgi:hypothetical protein
MAKAATPITKKRKVVEPVEELETVDTEDDFEELEEDDAVETGEELEELEDDEVEDETPAPKKKAKPSKTAAPKAEVVEFGSPWLAAHITEKTGETYDARGIRMLLRKLAKDGVHNRVVGEDRGRYSFSGPEDPTVKAVLAMVKSGAAKELKQAGLQAVKDKAAAKKAEKAKAKAAEVSEDEDDDEVEEAPAPAPKRKAGAAKPGPAKATASTKRKAKA